MATFLYLSWWLLLHFKYWIRNEPDQPLVLALTSSRIFTALDSSKAVLVPGVRHPGPKPWDVTVEIKEEKLAIHPSIQPIISIHIIL
jgi:hypothetical protein